MEQTQIRPRTIRTPLGDEVTTRRESDGSESIEICTPLSLVRERFRVEDQNPGRNWETHS